MTRNTLALQAGSALVNVPLTSISYIESRLHYLTIHTISGGAFRIRERISAFEERLRPAGFIRVHKSYLVRADAVRQATGSQVELATGEKIPVGRAYRACVREKIG